MSTNVSILPQNNERNNFEISQNLNFGKYIINDNGIKYYKDDKEVIVSNRPMVPSKIIKNPETQEETIEITYKNGFDEVEKKAVSKDILYNKRKIIGLASYGVDVSSNNAAELVKYFTELDKLNLKAMPRAYSVNKLGWYNKNFKSFIPYSEDIEFDGEQGYRQIYNAINKNGDYQTWKTFITNLRSTNSEVRILLATAFASPLLEPLCLKSFIVHIWGGTGVGKTVGVCVAASVWGNPSTDSGYVCNWNGTLNGKESTISFLNSIPYILDELQVEKDKNSFDRDIYTLTEGAGKERSNKGSGRQNLKTWNNCILSTGEQPITDEKSGGGAANRVLQISCTDKCLFDNFSVAINTVTNNYGFAGEEWVEYLLKPSNIKKIRKKFDIIFNSIKTAEIEDKQIAIAAILLTVDEFVTEIIFKDNNQLTFDDIKPYLAKQEDSCQELRAYNWLCEFVQRNSLKFITNNSAEVNYECWGKIDTQKEVVSIISAVLDEKMKEAGYNSKAFKAWADRKKILVKGNDGRKAKSVRLINGPARCICIIMGKQQNMITANNTIGNDNKNQQI